MFPQRLHRGKRPAHTDGRPTATATPSPTPSATATPTTTPLPPQVVAIEPILSANTASGILARFSTQVINGGPTTINLHGSQTGLLTGTYAGDGTNNLDFDYTASEFKPGEEIEVTLTQGIASARQIPMAAPSVHRLLAPVIGGAASFEPSMSPIGESLTISVALGDVDRDGDIDIALANCGSRNTIHFNDGNGNFDTESRTFDDQANVTFAIAFADVDGDGDLDLAAGNLTQQNALCINDGLGNVTSDIRPFGSGQDMATGLVFGDLDGDCDQDLATVNAYHNNSDVYRNDGHGHFTHHGSIDTEGMHCWSMSLGDLDGDGDLDLAACDAQTFGGQTMVYFNDGAGHFPHRSPVGRWCDQSYAAALGDVDGDGDLDIALAKFQKGNRLLINDGNGVFTNELFLGMSMDRTCCIKLADLDGDGDLDAVTRSMDAPAKSTPTPAASSLCSVASKTSDPRAASTPPPPWPTWTTTAT